jgi:hypothetical protein
MMSADADHHHGEGPRPHAGDDEGHYPMSEQGEHKVTDRRRQACPSNPRRPAGLPRVLVLVGGLTFLLDRTASSSTAVDPGIM